MNTVLPGHPFRGGNRRGLWLLLLLGAATVQAEPGTSPPRGKPIRPATAANAVAGADTNAGLVRLPGGVVLRNLPAGVLPTSPTNAVRLPAVAARRFEPLGFEAINFTLLARFFVREPEPGSEAERWAAVKAQIPEDVRVLDGKRVAIAGFMLPLSLDDGRSREFLLLRSQSACCFGMVPRVNELVLVRMAAPGLAPKVDVPVVVGGRLRVKWVGEGGQLTGIYELEGERGERVEDAR